MTALIVNKWETSNPKSPGWLGYAGFAAIVADRNAKGVIPSEMYDQQEFEILVMYLELATNLTASYQQALHYGTKRDGLTTYSYIVFESMDAINTYLADRESNQNFWTELKQARDPVLARLEMTLTVLQPLELTLDKDEIEALPVDEFKALLTWS